VQVVTIDPMRLNQGIDNWAITNVHDLLARAPNGDFAKTWPSDREAVRFGHLASSP
jgi:hypothetical protein